MERIPILRMGPFLLVTIQVDMHDRLAMTLQDDLTTMVSRTGARGVLIDISSLEMVDSFIGRMLGNIAAMCRVLDAQTVVVGMRPAVAITLVELGMALPGVRMALNVEKGMEILRASTMPLVPTAANGGNGVAPTDTSDTHAATSANGGGGAGAAGDASLSFGPASSEMSEGLSHGGQQT